MAFKGLKAAGEAGQGEALDSVRAKAPRRPVKQPHASKREAVLAEAASQFNRRGIGRTSLSEIAGALGLTRAALYYYVDDRDELVFQCYARACELAANDLDAAANADRGLDRVIDTLRRLLSPERPATAIVGEIGFLSGSLREVILKSHRRNTNTFLRFIASGIDDGSIRHCDAEIVGQALLGMLNWIPLSPGWTDEAAATYQSRMLEAVIDLIRNGVAASRDAAVAALVDIWDLVPRPGNAFDKKEIAAAKIEQLLMTASRLFNKNGIEATSIDDIAGSLGATKGAFYHYLNDKDDLIRRCYARAFDLYERIIDTAEATGATGLERGIIGLHLNVQAQVNGPWPLAPIIGAEALSPRARGEFTKRARQTEKRFTRFAIDGMADGSYRACDAEPIAIAGAGAFAWIPKWLPDNDKRGARRIADETADFFARGLGRV
jgi:AcrR family transcriptional regulator